MINYHISIQDHRGLSDYFKKSTNRVDVTLPHPLPSLNALFDSSKPLEHSPLRKAYIANDPEMVATLLDQVNFNYEDQKKRALEIFKYAVYNGKDEIVEVFLKSKNINLIELCDTKSSLGISLIKMEIQHISEGKENLKGTFKSLKPLIERRKKTMDKIADKIIETAPQSSEAKEALYLKSVYSLF